MFNSGERLDDAEEALRAAMLGMLSGLWTALPGQVQSFDPAAMTIVVQPGIQGSVRAADGSAAAVDLPLLVDVPVIFPGGGGVTLTFPIAAGDECLIIFASRAIDAWWQSGGIQRPTESRMHDLSDGFALVGLRSKARALGAISTSAAQLRNDAGEVVIDFNPTSKAIHITAPGKLTIDADVVINGKLDVSSDASIGGKADVTGNVTTQADAIAGTISLKNHVHLATMPGPPASTSGPPKP